MANQKIKILFLFLFLCTLTRAQNPGALVDTSKKITPADRKVGTGRVSVGFGMGLDHGGLFGVNFAVYPQKNIALWAAGGYALIGMGYNLGVKLRWVPKNEYYKACPFIEVMYGYNAVIKITNADQYNRMFYGKTIGVGWDICKNGAGWSFAVLVPIRGPEVDQYQNYLIQHHNVRITQELLPIAISIGFKIYFD